MTSGDSATARPQASSYYGRPILKEPVWKPEIAWYFFAGGLAGTSATLSLGARLAGNDPLARATGVVALAGLAVSPALLVKDLGRPERFYNMLRVFKVTSPMNIGTWVLTAAGTATAAAVALDLIGMLPRARKAAQVVSGLLGLPVSTYTAALVADTAIPAWHEARRELPFVFAASSAASAGAAGAILVSPGEARPARRLAVAGGALELAAETLMERRLGYLAEPYREGEAGRYGRLAKVCTAAGTLAMAAAGRSRGGVALGGSLLLAGSVLLRWSVFRAGFQSARDPRYTVEPQRRRVEERRRQAKPAI